MEVADVKYMEQQLKAQFDVQKEVYEKQIEDLKAQIDCFKKNTPLAQQALILGYRGYQKQVEEDNQVILAYDKDLRRANTKLDRIQEYCNETMRVMNNDTGGNPYAQGRTVEASRILEIIGE